MIISGPVGPTNRTGREMWTANRTPFTVKRLYNIIKGYMNNNPMLNGYYCKHVCQLGKEDITLLLDYMYNNPMLNGY